MTDEAPLGWLPPAQTDHRLSVDLWAPFEGRLADELSRLRESTFVICTVDVPARNGGAKGHKYLQYLLAEDGDDRHLIAEASALKFQIVVDQSASTQQALIDAMGWTRPDDLNHRHIYAWPRDLDQTVADSMRILRDVWSIAHPSLVTFGERTLMGDPAAPGLPTASRDEVLAALADWVGDLTSDSPEFEPGSEWVQFAIDDIRLHATARLDTTRIDVVAVIGLIKVERADVWRALVEAVSQDALVGNLSIGALNNGIVPADLRVSLPFEGLVPDSFRRHVNWLVSSTRQVRVRLVEEHLLAP
jgi:hypothetical protein